MSNYIDKQIAHEMLIEARDKAKECIDFTRKVLLELESDLDAIPSGNASDLLCIAVATSIPESLQSVMQKEAKDISEISERVISRHKPPHH